MSFYSLTAFITSTYRPKGESGECKLQHIYVYIVRARGGVLKIYEKVKFSWEKIIQNSKFFLNLCSEVDKNRCRSNRWSGVVRH